MVHFVALEKRALHQPNRQRSDYKKHAGLQVRTAFFKRDGIDPGLGATPSLLKMLEPADQEETAEA